MKRFLLPLIILLTACSSQSNDNLSGSSAQIDSTIKSSSLFQVARNDTTTAEAAAALGCIGYLLSAPVNLQQYNENPSFESLHNLAGRPWLVKLEEAGLASGRLSYGPGANQTRDAESLRKYEAVREYDMPSEAFSIASFLDSRWTPLSSIWQDSLNYALDRVNSGKKDLDTAYETVTIYGPQLGNICKISINGAIKNAQISGLPFSSYVYIQTAEYLIDWLPEFFNETSLLKFTSQFEPRGS